MKLLQRYHDMGITPPCELCLMKHQVGCRPVVATAAYERADGRGIDLCVDCEKALVPDFGEQEARRVAAIGGAA